MRNRLWRIYIEQPHTGASGDEPHGPRTREIYVTTLAASSAEEALSRYESLYGEKADYAIEDEDVTGSRII